MLLLDVGNSSVKWATQTNGQFRRGSCFRHDSEIFAHAAEQAWGSFEPTRVVVANVAGERMEQLISGWMKGKWGIAPEYLQASAMICGVKNAYAEPGKLGIDRWAAMIEAHHLYKGPVCIIDCGSAITIDALAADGGHLGGLIMPGIELQQGALVSNTADINGFSGEVDNRTSLLASETGEAVVYGTLYMITAAIDRVIADVSAECGEPLKTMITGGDAERILPLLTQQVQHEADLVLKGVARLAGESTCGM